MSLPEPAATGRTNKYTNRVILKTILERSDGGLGFVGQRMVIGGWVKSSQEIKKDTGIPLAAGTKDVSCGEVLSRFPLLRSIFKAFRGDGDSRVHDKPDDVQKPQLPSFMILKVSDGSSLHSLRVLVDSELAIPSQVMPTGTCIVAEGTLQQPASQGKHLIEFKADKVLHLGTVDQMKYPLSKKGLSMDYLWDWSHLRARTTTVASIMRIRDAMNQAFHTFFRENEFLYVHMPTMTSTNTSGSRKKFAVTTLLEKDKYDGMDTLEHITASIKEKSKLIEKLERSESNNEALVAAKMDLEMMKKVISCLGSKMHLTASGRLHLESQACALGNVYTSGPRFQEKKSESKKSLPEMLVVETEMAFSKLEDAMNCADDLLKFICKSVLENSTEDVKFLSKRSNKSITVMEHLNFITSCSLKRVSYTEAVNDLKLATEKKFGKPIEWGVQLSDEHTSYLVDEIYKGPIFIYNHPKNLKPFNVRLNDDAKTVASFDILFPKVGLLISGSQSEERLKTMSSRIEEVGLPKQQYEWYLDLRRHGTVEHSGFSVMFDSFVLFATGRNDIRDVVPFPVRSSKTST
ncbi:unnamed protein product [Cuscuta epithymum]|uniref:asparagine--tRNA ligase n=1 Tax=Cuscuta epithymum TaxID=186058 RepID=A0AAV0FTA1_9ASTE|nr:unnamed protein product [Cuscuta epithymum]